MALSIANCSNVEMFKIISPKRIQFGNDFIVLVRKSKETIEYVNTFIIFANKEGWFSPRIAFTYAEEDCVQNDALIFKNFFDLHGWSFVTSFNEIVRYMETKNGYMLWLKTDKVYIVQLEFVDKIKKERDEKILKYQRRGLIGLF